MLWVLGISTRTPQQPRGWPPPPQVCRPGYPLTSLNTSYLLRPARLRMDFDDRVEPLIDLLSLRRRHKTTAKIVIPVQLFEPSQRRFESPVRWRHSWVLVFSLRWLLPVGGCQQAGRDGSATQTHCGFVFGLGEFSGRILCTEERKTTASESESKTRGDVSAVLLKSLGGITRAD